MADGVAVKSFPVKTLLLFGVILFPVLAFAQFPEPGSFAITVNYILEGQSDWCDEHIIQGPAYCNLFSWETPDTANTPATLTGYRIYKDCVFFLATANTIADTAGGYMASFYVTAIYENPAGESEASNVVVINDLPMGTEEAFHQEPIGIRFDPMQQMLVIRGAEQARSLRVYDVQGKLLYSTDVVPTILQLEGLDVGVYWVIVERSGMLYSKMFIR